MEYLCKRGLFHDGKLYDAGQTVVIDDADKASRLVEKGTIVEKTEGAVIAPTPSPFEAAQAETQELNTARIAEEAAQRAREAAVNEELASKQAEGEATGDTPLQPQVTVDENQPTPEQITEDLNLLEDSKGTSPEAN